MLAIWEVVPWLLEAVGRQTMTRTCNLTQQTATGALPYFRALPFLLHQHSNTHHNAVRDMFLFLALCFFLACGSAQASPPNQASNSAQAYGSGSLYHSSRGTLHLTLRVAGAPTERFLFSLPPDYGVRSQAIHLTGTSASKPTDPARASTTLSLFEASAFLFFTSRRHSRPITMEIPLPTTGGSLTIRRAMVHRGRAGQTAPCAGEPLISRSTATLAPLQPTLKLPYSKSVPTPKLREVTMEISYDSLFAPTILHDRSSYIAALVYAANQNYLKRVGVELRIRRLLPLEGPLPTSQNPTAEELLDVFRSTVLPSTKSTDLVHLFTGSSLESGTSGIAYVGAACVHGGEYAVGLSRSVSPAIQMIVFAHEVLHGLGASHDESPYSVMSPLLTTNNRRLSQSTRNSVSNFLKQYGGCIKPPRALSTSIDIGFPNGLFSARVLVVRPKTAPCTALLQGRLPPASTSNRRASSIPPWRNIAEVALPPVSKTDTSSINLTAPAPPTQIHKTDVVSFRATVRCADTFISSGTTYASPPRLDTVGAADPASGDWIDQLINSIQTRAEIQSSTSAP